MFVRTTLLSVFLFFAATNSLVSSFQWSNEWQSGKEDKGAFLSVTFIDEGVYDYSLVVYDQEKKNELHGFAQLQENRTLHSQLENGCRVDFIPYQGGINVKTTKACDVYKQDDITYDVFLLNQQKEGY